MTVLKADKLVPAVLIAFGVVGGLGGAASGVGAVHSGAEQQASHVRLEAKLDELMRLEREHAESLARIEERLSWVVSGNTIPPSQPPKGARSGGGSL